MGGENIVTAPVLSDYQFQYGSLVIGASTGYRLREISGLGQPSRRSTDIRRPLADGDFSGTSYYESREITISIDLVAASASAATTLLSALSLAWRGSGILYAKFPGWSAARAFYGEPRKLVSSDRSDHRSGYLPVSLLFYSPAPAMYADIVTVGAATAVTAGLSFPSVLPWIFGVVSSGTELDVVNDGDYNYSPVMRLYGPFTSATVTRSSDGAYIGIGATIAAGEYVDIDHDARTIVKSDGTNLRRYLINGSRWLSTPPGSDVFTMTATDTLAAYTHIEIDARSAWLA